MNDWVGLGLILLIVVGGIYALVRANEASSRKMTEAEYEERLKENKGRSMLSAGVMGLQTVLEPAAKRGVEVVQDFRAGHYDSEQESGEDKDKTKVKE
ncbi:MAG TPA: hypothetical protein VGB17_13215 [Pyrinomonadaceae bacterium]|jgi:hypothetical protein